MFNKHVNAVTAAGATRVGQNGTRKSRKLPRSLALSALSLALCAAALPAAAANWWVATPSLSIGSTTINVRNAGAKGDGVHDDTAAFQAAINSLPSTGGTITVPAGKYMINALKSIVMRSHTRLQLDPSAQLVAIPNSSQRYIVVKAWGVNNVDISGGSIVGERAKHIGTTGEWGFGVDINASSKVYLHDTHISDFWGDGIWIGALGRGTSAVVSTDVTVNRVTSTNNRRQGLSIGPVDRVYVVNSTFSNSNGTAPQAGIDIEPMTQGLTKNVRIEASVMTGNAGNGLELHNYVSGVVLKSSTLKQNHGFGVLSVGATNGWLALNTMTENGLDGVGLTSTTSNFKVTSNTVTYNSTRWYYAHNKSIYTLSSSDRDFNISSTTSNIYLANNTVSPKP